VTPRSEPAPRSDAALLDVRDLVVPAVGRRRLRRARTVALDGVSLQVHRGETYGVVGESGSGAVDLARAIATPATRTAGEVRLDGVDVGDMDAPQRRRRIRTLRPGHEHATVAGLLAEEMRSAGLPEPDDAGLRELVAVVELPDGVLRRGTQELTDGERRRVDVARALCTGPDLLVADDPVAGLDVTVAAQLLDLLGRVKAERGLACLLVARDLGVVRHLSDRVGVLYRGRIVEESPARALYRGPRHPYTRALLSAVPVPDPEVEDRRERILLTGDPPLPADPARGCAFQPRCPWRRPERCADEHPPLRTVGTAGHLAACHYAEEIDG
jgi:oligopeptide/dipeptide ABC transporter ATP-binding protein